jgi:hypothetical protein
MPGDDHPGTAVLLEAAHRSQPRRQPAVVALDAVVGVAVGTMPRRRQQLLQHGRVHRRLIGGDLGRAILVVPIARSKNRWAALVSRREATKTSMTCPTWSMAR